MRIISSSGERGSTKRGGPTGAGTSWERPSWARAPSCLDTAGGLPVASLRRGRLDLAAAGQRRQTRETPWSLDPRRAVELIGDAYVTSFYTDEVIRYDGTTGAFTGTFVTT